MPVRKRGSVWWYDFQIRGIRYRQPVPEAVTKRQAEEAERQARNAVFENRYQRFNNQVNFAEFLDKTYLPWSRANKRSYKVDEYRAPVLKSYFGKRDLRDITPMLIEQYKRERLGGPTQRKTGRSGAAVNRELALLSRIFTMAMDNGLLEANPCSQVRKFKEPESRERFLTYAEEEKLLASLTGRRAHLRPIVILALYTGLRRGEILKLEKRDVDFSANTIHVRGSNSKSGKSRTVPMNEIARDELLKVIKDMEPDGRVFARGHFGSIGNIKTGFATACEEACIPYGKDTPGGFVFHDLRHTYATRLGMRGVRSRVIQELLGHSSLRMTQKYEHVTRESLQEAAATLVECQAEVVDLRKAASQGVSQ